MLDKLEVRPRRGPWLLFWIFCGKFGFCWIFQNCCISVDPSIRVLHQFTVQACIQTCRKSWNFSKSDLSHRNLAWQTLAIWCWWSDWFWQNLMWYPQSKSQEYQTKSPKIPEQTFKTSGWFCCLSQAIMANFTPFRHGTLVSIFLYLFIFAHLIIILPWGAEKQYLLEERNYVVPLERNMFQQSPPLIHSIEFMAPTIEISGISDQISQKTRTKFLNNLNSVSTIPNPMLKQQHHKLFTIIIYHQNITTSGKCDVYF